MIKGVAWATPVIILSTAAPAAASSTNGASSGAAVVVRDGQLVTVTVPVTSTATNTVTATMIVRPDLKGVWSTPNANGQTTGPYPITQVVTGGTTSSFAFPGFKKNNNGDNDVHFTITFTVNGVADPSMTVPLTQLK